eukprot:scaffold304091_cov33-Tisochrysis_lutea.AAC.7
MCPCAPSRGHPQHASKHTGSTKVVDRGMRRFTAMAAVTASWASSRTRSQSFSRTVDVGASQLPPTAITDGIER